MIPPAPDEAPPKTHIVIPQMSGRELELRRKIARV
jgi:hypothetical protein